VPGWLVAARWRHVASLCVSHPPWAYITATAGVVLPVLGALPDSLIILSSLNATRAEAESQVAVGVGESCRV
jgi:hypothetical protein